MAGSIIGMDFGTTNSGMAVGDGRGLRFLPLDDARPQDKVVRTAVYITTDQQIHIGRTAVDTYLEQNRGRAVRMERVWVGEIEVRAEDMYYVDDVYIYNDVLSPGRLFLSLKSGLREPDYVGTVVGQFFYSLEDLIALYLTVTRERAAYQLGYEPREVVLGRPVRFAFSPEQDRLAQARLLEAAFRAGYERVHFQYEPIAAAYSYATTLTQPETILVFDFGGGTLDVTIMRLDPHTGQKEILATGGVPIAGDLFDQKLVRAKLPRHFGEGSYYRTEHKRMPVPSWIYDTMADWQHILELQSPTNKLMLADIAQKAERPREIEGLISLVAENYALNMFDAAERAKQELSDKMGALIKLDGPKFHVRQLVTRTDFEGIIRSEVQAIESHLADILAQAQIKPEEIEVVVRTGGSAEIPIFRRLLADMFGREKLREVDTFGSVTAGLGIIAQGVEAGQIDLPGYTPADLPTKKVESQPRVSPVNLTLLQKRIALQEGNVTDEAVTGGTRLVLLAPGNVLVVGHPTALSLSWSTKPSWLTAVRVDYDAPLLLLTNLYRFLLITPRQLDELAELKMGLADLHQFRKGEEVYGLADWEKVKTRPWLSIITSRGYARAYRLSTLAPLIESPAPYQFDEALPGVPVALLGTTDADELLMYADNGRALRVPMNHPRLRVRGVQAMQVSDAERVVGGWVLTSTNTEDEWALVTASGHGRRLWLEQVPVLGKGESNQKPPLLSTRRPLVGLAPLAEVGWLLLSGGETRPCDPAGLLPPPEAGKKTFPLVKLARGQGVLGVC